MSLLPPHLEKYLVSNKGDKSSSSGDAPVEPIVKSIGAKHAKAIEITERKASALAKSRQNAKRVKRDMHAAIGTVINGVAGLEELSVIHVLGLASKVKSILETPGGIAELAEEGRRIFVSEKRPTSSLTIVGVSPERGIDAELRDIGFVRAGQQWSGAADVAEAVSLARKHKLTLLRYGADHIPQIFLLKGQDQPALEELMEEARVQEEETEAYLAAFIGWGRNNADENPDLVEEPSMDTGTAEPPGPAVEEGAERGDDDISPLAQAPLVEESTEPPKPAQVQIGFKRPGKPHAL